MRNKAKKFPVFSETIKRPDEEKQEQEKVEGFSLQASGQQKMYGEFPFGKVYGCMHSQNLND